jgi:AraC-like DNA-binding protein
MLLSAKNSIHALIFDPFFMQFTFNYQSSILLIFFINGLVFTVLLLKKGFGGDRSSLWLSAFTFLCGLYICPWMLGHASWYFNQPYRDILFYTPTQQVLLLGPVMYFYVQSLLNSAFRFDAKAALHLVPASAYLLYSLIVFITDVFILKTYYFYENQRDKDLDNWYQIAGLLSMVLYAAFSFKYYINYKNLIYNVLSYADTVKFDWIRKFLLIFVAMQLLRAIFLVLFPNWGDFSYKWIYYVLFSILFCYVAFMGYLNSVVTALSFRFQPFEAKGAYLVVDEMPAPYNVSAAMNTDRPAEQTEKLLAEWKDKIWQLIDKEQLYENERLSLNDLAAKLNTHPTLISKAVNQCFGMNFNDFINQFRVEAVRERLDQGQHKVHTLLGIAYECGFNSKSTFNRAFKKVTGLAPTEYMQKLG